MMAGVVRRDGLREAVEKLRDEWSADLDGSGGKVIRDETARHCWDLATRELSHILDAVPDVPPDPPAVDRDELANVLHLRYHSKKADRDCAYFNHERCRIYAEASRDVDHLLSSGVLVDAADVRARARIDTLRDLADFFMTRDGPGYVVEEICRRIEGDGAVSERERGTT